jgi:excisionase family DNA binding protein
MPIAEQLLTIRDVAHRLSVSTRTIYRLRDKGQLPEPLYVGASVRYKESDVQVFLRMLEKERRA